MVSYLNMVMLEKNAQVILTDSGGVQKEAYWFKVPCLTLREETEWRETINSGWNRLVGIDVKRMVVGVRPNKKRRPPRENIFGDGKASQNIVDLLWRAFH